METRRSHRSWAWILVAMGFAALMAGLFWPSRRPRRRVIATMEAASPTFAPPATRPPEPDVPVPPAKQAAPAAPPEPPPVIDAIVVEKPEVCSGEENLITVQAHTVNGTDEFLHYVVDGALGSSVPVRLLLGADGRVEGQHTITVFGRTNVPITVAVPEYTVRDCQPERVVVVESRVQANTWSEFDLMARVIALPEQHAGIRSEGSHKPFAPVSYAWTFGDGVTATTTGPVASHDYEGRAQDSLYSYFPVRVDVRSATGEVLTGRTTLPLINPAFEAFAQKGIVQLLVSLDPRFPEIGPDGRVVQNVRLWHTRPQPMTIDAVAVTRYFEGASGETPPQAVDVAQLVGAGTVPPGKEGVTTSVVLDTITEPGVFSMTYRLSGHSPDGHLVMGSFSVMRPPPKPTADNSEAVADPMLKAKIMAAREILGKDTVNDEDLWQLERQGRFADLAPATTGPATAPATNAPATNAPATTGPATAPATNAAASGRSSARPPAMPAPGVEAYGPPVPTGETPPPAVTTAEQQEPSPGRGNGHESK